MNICIFCKAARVRHCEARAFPKARAALQPYCAGHSAAARSGRPALLLWPLPRRRKPARPRTLAQPRGQIGACHDGPRSGAAMPRGGGKRSHGQGAERSGRRLMLPSVSILPTRAIAARSRKLARRSVLPARTPSWPRCAARLPQAPAFRPPHLDQSPSPGKLRDVR